MKVIYGTALALLLMGAATFAQDAPKAETIESVKAALAARDKQINALGEEVVRLRVELRTQTEAARGLSVQLERIEIQKQQEQARAAQAAAAKKETPKP